MPTISILTPTWNRAGYLPRVWESLSAQTSTDFEWIVADDGSEDDTEQVVRGLAARSSFPVLYLKAEAHVGKARMDNEAIRRARGEFVLWCDSDDWLEPQAVERLLSTWHSIGPADRSQFFGIAALAATEHGVIINPFPDAEFQDVRWNDYTLLHRHGFDMALMVRTEMLQSHPFPEVDLYIPEGAVWSVIGHRMMRLVPEVLLMKEYLAAHAVSVSYSGKMSYNRGRAHASAIVRRVCRSYAQSFWSHSRGLVNFVRYCCHGEISLSEARRLWSDNSNSVAFWASVPIGLLLAVVDRLQNKVVRSHREFLANRDSPVREFWLRTDDSCSRGSADAAGAL